MGAPQVDGVLGQEPGADRRVVLRWGDEAVLPQPDDVAPQQGDPAGQPVEVQGDHTPVTGRSPGGGDGHAVQDVAGVTAGGHVGDVPVGEVEGEAVVTDDGIPVGHEVGLGHDRQRREVGTRDLVGVDVDQPGPVPG